ncbi:MAG: extracellular solute-binding protein [Deltaproteobacteria bacterium]|nr:extracellular solute-binding protein [Deltaproteobacteria bacterium]
MKLGYFKAVGSSLILLSLASWVAASSILAADPAVLQAKKEAEAKGYIFYTTHDEIVAMAKKEGKLRVMIGLEPANYKPWINAFKQRYPFIDTYVEEITGTDALQRFILEMKSGQVKAWDTTSIAPEFRQDYPPYLKKHDILGMAKQGVLKIHPGMIHPVERNIVSFGSALEAIAYNRKLLSEDKAPAKWEDFLKPEFKGKKFVLDIQCQGLAALVPAWGLEKTLDFARKLAAQQPVWWGGGASRVNTSIAAGEYSLFWGPTFSSVKRAMAKDRTGSLSYKLIAPIPARVVDQASGILNTADHPHAALLWFEFLASPEGQEIIDKYEPLKASVFTPGSVVAQEVRGKELSGVDWDHVNKFQGYIEKIFAAFGFPKADKKK